MKQNTEKRKIWNNGISHINKAIKYEPWTWVLCNFSLIVTPVKTLETDNSKTTNWVMKSKLWTSHFGVLILIGPEGQKKKQFLLAQEA